MLCEQTLDTKRRIAIHSYLALNLNVYSDALVMKLYNVRWSLVMEN